MQESHREHTSPPKLLAGQAWARGRADLALGTGGFLCQDDRNAAGERTLLEICPFSCCWAREQICSWCQARKLDREDHWAAIQLHFRDPWSGVGASHAHSPELGKVREPRQAGRLALSSLDLTLAHVRACDVGWHRLGRCHLLPSPHCPSGCVMPIGQGQL